MPLVAIAIGLTAAAAQACDKPVFVWNATTVGGSDCLGHCGYFQTPSVSFFVSRDGTTFSWSSRGDYRVEAVVGKSAQGRDYRPGPKDNSVNAGAGDRYVEVSVTASNCHPPKLKSAAADRPHTSRSPIVIILASVLLVAAAGALGAVWLRDRGVLDF